MKAKAVDLHVKWCKPLTLLDGSYENLIYTIDDLDEYEQIAGVYMFCTYDDNKLSPIYIGKSMNIALRTRQHFNETKFMKKLQRIRSEKVLIIGTFIPKGKKSIPKWIKFIEDILIKEALENKADLINIKGTVIKKHRIKFSGYSGGSDVFGKLIHC